MGNARRRLVVRDQRLDGRPDETHRQRVADEDDEVQPHPRRDRRRQHAHDQARETDAKTSMQSVALGVTATLDRCEDVDAAVKRGHRQIAAVLEAELVPEKEEQVVEVVRRGQ